MPNNMMQQVMRGWRGDGQQVPPGNEPDGGANGQFGHFGQNPDATIPPPVEKGIHGAAQGYMKGLQATPGGQLISAVLGHYGPQGRRDRAMNDQAGSIRQGDMQANADQLQQPPDDESLSQVTPYPGGISPIKRYRMG